MDFELDENQRAIAELAAEVLRKEGEHSGDFHEQAWAALAKVGLLSLALPPELGGDGLGIGEVAVVLAEVGRQAAAVPALATLALAVLPIAAHGTDAQRAALLPDVATGTSLLTGAPNEPGAPLTGHLVHLMPLGASTTPSTRATPSGARWQLTGTKAAVPFAEHAHRVLVPARTPQGTGVFIVDPRSEGVALQRTPSAGGTPEYTLRLDAAAGELLGDDHSGAAAAALRAYTLAGAAALGDGALAGALELTTVHLRTRHQFGKPLATFQAVAQQIADVYVASRTVHLATQSAVWRLASALDAHDELELAGYWLAAEALPAMRTCHHLHGGLGVDVTYPLHRHYSLLKDLARLLGGAAHRLEALGA